VPFDGARAGLLGVLLPPVTDDAPTTSRRPPEDVSDTELVEAMAAGDQAALGRLYDRFAPALTALGMRLLRNERDTEDLLHDVFLEAWRQAGDYDAGRGTVRSWLIMRMRSRALDRLKSVAHTRVVSLEVVTLPEAPGNESPGLGGDQGRVQAALAQLPADQQRVLELAYFEGFSLAEIATLQGAPLGTIKSRLARALGRLREVLRELGERDP
jgi:RNA polymerase sigma-70 factor (ECF subfamily)